MNQLLLKIKDKNLQTTKTLNKVFPTMVIVMILIGVILLLVDLDKFITPAILIIFFSIIGAMIVTFLSILRASKNRHQYIKNSINLAYKHYIDEFNLNQSTNYQVSSDVDGGHAWFLLPSFGQKSINFKFENDEIKMFHAETYVIANAEQRKTYFFKGLYVTVKGVKGDIQYRDKDSFSDRLIEGLKDVYGEDRFDKSIYACKVPFESGMIYSHSEQEPPAIIRNLLSTLKSFDFIQSLRIGLLDNELQIAITQNGMRLPYVKRYNAVELDKIKQVTFENLNLLEQVRDVLKNVNK